MEGYTGSLEFVGSHCRFDLILIFWNEELLKRSLIERASGRMECNIFVEK
jgi:hypothetical protein